MAEAVIPAKRSKRSARLGPMTAFYLAAIGAVLTWELVSRGLAPALLGASLSPAAWIERLGAQSGFWAVLEAAVGPTPRGRIAEGVHLFTGLVVYPAVFLALNGRVAPRRATVPSTTMLHWAGRGAVFGAGVAGLVLVGLAFGPGALSPVPGWPAVAATAALGQIAHGAAFAALWARFSGRTGYCVARAPIASKIVSSSAASAASASPPSSA